MATTTDDTSSPTETTAKELSPSLTNHDNDHPHTNADDLTLQADQKSANELYNYESHEDKKPCDRCCTSDKVVNFLRIDRVLLPIKVFYFSFIGGLGCVLPYVSVFLKQLGLNPQQIGLISGIRPVIGFISGPLWGIVGDKYNIRKCLLLFSITAWLGFYVGLYFIPPAGRVDECPQTTHRPIKQFEKRLLHHRPGRAVSNVTVGPSGHPVNSTPTYTKQEASVLKESIGWIYDPAGLQTVFIVSFVVVIGGEFVQAPTTALSDAGALQTLGPAGLESYGPQRAWGPVGWAIRSVYKIT